MKQGFKEEIGPAFIGLAVGLLISTVIFWTGGFDLRAMLWVDLAIVVVLAIRYVIMGAGLGSSFILRLAWNVLGAALFGFCFVVNLLELPDNHGLKQVICCFVFALIAVRSIVNILKKLRQYFRVRAERRLKQQ